MKIYGKNENKLFGIWFENKYGWAIELYIYSKFKFKIDKEEDEYCCIFDIYFFNFKIMFAFLKWKVKWKRGREDVK